MVMTRPKGTKFQGKKANSAACNAVRSAATLRWNVAASAQIFCFALQGRGEHGLLLATKIVADDAHQSDQGTLEKKSFQIKCHQSSLLKRPLKIPCDTLHTRVDHTAAHSPQQQAMQFRLTAATAAAVAPRRTSCAGFLNQSELKSIAMSVC